MLFGGLLLFRPFTTRSIMALTVTEHVASDQDGFRVRFFRQLTLCMATIFVGPCSGQDPVALEVTDALDTYEEAEAVDLQEITRLLGKYYQDVPAEMWSVLAPAAKGRWKGCTVWGCNWGVVAKWRMCSSPVPTSSPLPIILLPLSPAPPPPPAPPPLPASVHRCECDVTPA